MNSAPFRPQTSHEHTSHKRNGNPEHSDRLTHQYKGGKGNYKGGGHHQQQNQTRRQQEPEQYIEVPEEVYTTQPSENQV
jgi:hypothetical protein